MLNVKAQPRNYAVVAIALCAIAIQGALYAGEPDGGTVAPVVDGREYRQAMAGKRLPPVLPEATRREVLPASAVTRLAQLQAMPEPELLESVPASKQLPPGFVPWWQSYVGNRLRADADVHPVDLDALIVSALAYSPRVRAVSQDVLIQDTAVCEAQAAFDIHAFMDSKFFRRSDPIGNELETGGPPRLREGDFGYSAGLRKRTPLGGSWEMSQRIGLRDSNSRFFTPEQQGNSRLALSFNQPLLNGFGKPYNTALIVLADIDTNVAMDQTSTALQAHLIQISEAYWELYLQRAVLLQKRMHLKRSQVILDRLTSRREVDALENQIVRAEAAVAARQAELVRTVASIRNVEAKIRALTNAPELASDPYSEMIPLDRPSTVEVPVSLPDALVTALQHRPEVDAAAQEIRAASVRLDMSRNELLPALDLILETYVSGLDQDYDITQAVIDQFSVGEPSYTAGLVFEVPLHRRAAKARYQRRQLQLRQITQEFDATVQVLLTDVEITVREVAATYQEMVGKYRAMMAAQAEVDYLTNRWELLAGDDRSVSFLLEDLLDAQDRLMGEEFGFAMAQRDYTVSQMALKRATGTLLQHEQIEPVRVCRDGLPELRFQRTARVVSPADVLPPITPSQSRAHRHLR
jgi:outer membrane protein TolC